MPGDIDRFLWAQDGVVDAPELRSSMTLFYAVCSNDVFADVLGAFFFGERDSLTLAVIDAWE
ncbi:MAG: DUF1810 family protein [Halieaceae bacterium]|jgi:uncharacterized protein (DUF1810 family)|nr:DUF1810 family protein [Halieaceae bacterium]